MTVINTEKDLIKYRNHLAYTFTLDDFIAEYRVGKTNAKKYLKEVHSITLTQSLFLKLKKQYPETIKHKKYYNENEIFMTLLDKGIIKFKYRKLFKRYSDIERLKAGDWYEKDMREKDIPKDFIKEHLDFFKYDCLKYSGTAGDMAKLFENDPKRYERAVNNKETSIVSIIGNTKRYKVLLDTQDKLDHIISFNIINALKEIK